jgi:hypothetical protein
MKNAIRPQEVVASKLDECRKEYTINSTLACHNCTMSKEEEIYIIVFWITRYGRV